VLEAALSRARAGNGQVIGVVAEAGAIFVLTMIVITGASPLPCVHAMRQPPNDDRSIP